MKLSPIIFHYLFAAIILAGFRIAFVARPFHFHEAEIQFWMLVLAVFSVGAFFYAVHRGERVRLILECAAFIFALEGIWIALCYAISPGAAFFGLIVFLWFCLGERQRVKRIGFAFGAAIFSLFYALVFPPIHLFLLYGGLIIYDTLMFRDGVRPRRDNAFWRCLRVDDGSPALSHLIFPLVFFAQLLYLHPAFAVTVWSLFLIALSNPCLHERETAAARAYALLLPFSLSFFIFHYATQAI